MRKCKLGDLFEIKQGYAFKSEKYQSAGKYVLCTLGNISADNNFKYDLSKANYYPDDFSHTFILEEGDLIIPLTEQAVGLFGNTAFVPSTNGFQFVLNQRVGKVIPKKAVADKYYLHYLLSTELVRNQIEATATGTSQRNTSPEKIYDATVWVPDIEQQRKIGKTLFDLERKVNINKLINDNLQQMAYDTYMHLFLKKQPNGKLGKIIVENNKSSVQVGEAKGKSGDYPFFTSGDAILEWDCSMVDGRNCFLNTGGNAGVKFYIGEAAYSTDTWCITANSDLEDYLYLLLLSIKPELNQKFFQGTGLKHLQKPLLKDRLIYIPSEEEIKGFKSKVQPLMDMVSANTRENKRLINLRDWLLPMLMNGQATVSD